MKALFLKMIIMPLLEMDFREKAICFLQLLAQLVEFSFMIKMIH